MEGMYGTSGVSNIPNGGSGGGGNSAAVFFNPKNLEIKTRSVEKALEPLVMQVRRPNSRPRPVSRFATRNRNFGKQSETHLFFRSRRW